MQVAPWVTPADLPTGLPGGGAELAGACDLASAVLYGLSGRRWAGHATRTIEVRAAGHPWWWRDAALGLPWDTAAGLWGGSPPALPVIAGGEVYNTSGGQQHTIRLPDYPVQAVTEVRIGADVVDPDSYWLTGSRFLERHHGSSWPSCGLGGDRLLAVTYSHGAVPPPAAKAAAVRLAAELSKASAGQPSALPGYLMQRVRQGETLTYVRADTLFDKGRTGLADVDLWLTTVNPAGLRRRARTWSPDTDPHYRTTDSGGTTP